MSRKSAGILAWRADGNAIKVLLVHPGGPFFSKKDAGAWSIPKGEYNEDEDPLMAAKREFAEELGSGIAGVFTPLGSIKQKGGKAVSAWAVETNFDTSGFTSNTFSLEWPPRSGKMKEFPEVDKAEWFSLAEGKEKINPAQVEFIDLLEHIVNG